MVKHLACLLLLAATTVGCQVKPGEYRVYRLTYDPVVTRNCSPAEMPNMDHTSMSDLFGTGLIAIYATDADTYFLESGSTASLGTRDGSVYSFHNESTQVDNWKTVEGYSRNFTATKVVETDATLELKGKGLSGTVVFFEEQACGGSTMDCQIANAVPYSCTTESKVYGTEVDDVDIEYVINGGGGLP